MRKIVFATIVPSWSMAAICAAVLMLAGCGPVSNHSPKEFSIAPGQGIALDGDTFDTDYREGPKSLRVRLLRIDAPELPGHPCPAYGRQSCVDDDPVWAGESKQHLQSILDNYTVYCTPEPKLDVYGRTLAECTIVDGRYERNLNNAMLTSGMAVPYRR